MILKNGQLKALLNDRADSFNIVAQVEYDKNVYKIDYIHIDDGIINLILTLEK
jgi:hypothetical protein